MWRPVFDHFGQYQKMPTPSVAPALTRPINCCPDDESKTCVSYLHRGITMARAVRCGMHMRACGRACMCACMCAHTGSSTCRSPTRRLAKRRCSLRAERVYHDRWPARAGNTRMQGCTDQSARTRTLKLAPPAPQYNRRSLAPQYPGPPKDRWPASNGSHANGTQSTQQRVHTTDTHKCTPAHPHAFSRERADVQRCIHAPMPPLIHVVPPGPSCNRRPLARRYLGPPEGQRPLGPPGPR